MSTLCGPNVHNINVETAVLCSGAPLTCVTNYRVLLTHWARICGYPLRISDGKWAILTSHFRGFCPFSPGILRNSNSMRPRQFNSRSFPVFHSSVILQFEATQILITLWNNPQENMGVSVCVYSVCVVVCVGSGLAMGWSLVRGVLPIVYRIKKLKNRPRPNKKGCRTIDRQTDRQSGR
jgi:hypothetical protein